MLTPPQTNSYEAVPTPGTRWRDFGDIYRLTGHNAFRAGDIRRTLQAVADFRRVVLLPFDELIDGYAEIAQSRGAPTC